MMACRSAPRVLAVALLGLLLLAAALQQSAAGLAILQRALVLSWDNPSTQLHDEAASQGAAYTDGSRQAHDHTRLVLRPQGRLSLPSEPAPRDSVAVGTALTRSPPISARPSI
jgi:hypothetical protein